MSTTPVNEAMRRLGAFTAMHEGHEGAESDVSLSEGTIWLHCKECETTPEILTMDKGAWRRAVGAELSEERSVSF